MIDKVRKSIKDHSLIRSGDAVCVAVSGGIDSTVLLHVLYALREELELKLVVCHLNHNLRGAEATRDKNFVKMLAKRLRLPFESAKLLKKDIGARSGESLQEWARKRRIEFLTACAEKHGAKVIALGHNTDDQCETVLMRLVKGASLRGISGIAYKREGFVRPMLGVTRGEIEVYAEASEIEYVEDSSNRSTKYLRNDIRRNLMPVLERYNPRVREAVARGAELFREDETCLASLAASAFKDAQTSPAAGRRGKKKEIIFDRQALLGLPPSILRRVFTMAVYSLDTSANPSVYTAQIEGFVGLVKGRTPNISLKLSDGLYVSRTYDKVVVSGNPPELLKATSDEIGLPVPGKASLEGVGVVSARVQSSRPTEEGGKNVAYFDEEALPVPLTLRTVRAGDRMRPKGMEGRKKLKDIFIDEKLTPEQRSRTLLVLSDGAIIWASGLRRSGVAPVTASTKKVLKLTLKPQS